MKRFSTMIFMSVMFCIGIINTQAQNILEGWDDTAGTPYDAGWRVDGSISVTWGTLNGSDNRYRTNLGSPVYNGSDPMLYITLADTKYGYPVTVTEGKVYGLAGKAWRRNGSTGSVAFNFCLAEDLLGSDPVSETSLTVTGNNVVSTFSDLRLAVPEGFTSGYFLWDVHVNSGTWNDAGIWLLNITELGNAIPVVFNTNGGSEVESQYFLEGESYTVSTPSTPIKTGYIFEGWYSDEALTSAFDFSASVTTGTTIYARWNDIKGELSALITEAEGLLTGGTPTGQSYLNDEITSAQTVVDDVSATVEQVSIALDSLTDAISNYQDASLLSLLVNSSDIDGFDANIQDYVYDLAPNSAIPTVSATANDAATIDITQASAIPGSGTVIVTAGNGSTKTYTVVFKFNYMTGWDGNGIGTTTDVPSDFGWACSSSVTWVDASNDNDNYAYRYRDNLGVGRAFTHPANDNVFSFPIELKAGSIYQFSCTNSNINGAVTTMFGINSTSDASGTMLNSQTLIAPKWSTNTAFSFFFSADVDGTYYMVWQTTNGSDRNVAWDFYITEAENALSVVFDTDGGSSIAKQYFADGESYTIVEPDEPTKDGYVFAGWYTDNTYSVPFDFTNSVSENTTLYARFVTQENPVMVDLTINNDQVSITAAKYMNITVSGTSELHLTSTEPLLESSINLESVDSWLYLDAVKPSTVIAEYLSNIKINGADFNEETDRIAIYGGGTVIIPNGKVDAQQALTIYNGTDFSGESMQFEINNYYRSAELGSFDNNVRSFKLKKGYSCTFANNENGTGFSRVYIASDSDLEVPVMPEGLDFVSFVRVLRWEWISKKGICGSLPGITNSSWFYDWGASASTGYSDYEYVPMRHNAGWASFDVINSRTNVSHVLGYNEPSHTDQANMTVEEAIRQWPELFKSGLRLGSPAPDAIRKQWLVDFLEMADSLNYRVDFVAGHMYWSGQTGQGLYNSITDVCTNLYGGRPMWITEWNNGANWTSETWPTASGPQRDADMNIIYDEDGNTTEVTRPLSPENAAKQLAWIQDALDGLDRCEYLERHAFYNWVQDARAVALGGKLTPAGEYFADYKSKVGFSKTKEYIHTWHIAPPLPSYTLSDDYSSCILKWYDHNGETGTSYIIERKLEGESDFTTLATLVPGDDYTYGSNVTYSDPITNSAEYRVKAVSYKDTESIYSRIVTLTLDPEVTAPIDLSGTVVSSSIIDLSWSAVDGARSYNLKRSATVDGTYETIGSYLTGLTYRDSELAEGTTYYYKISSVNNLGETEDSEPVTVTTNTIVVPTAISGVFASSGDSQIALTWDFQYDVLYRIYRSDSEDGNFVMIADNIDATRYADKELTNGQIYFYKVAAFNTAGEFVDPVVYQITPKYGQYAYFNFDETSGTYYDSWGGYNGTPNATASVTGVKNNAVDFVADDKSYVQLASGLTSDLDDFTISFWGNLTTKGSRIFDFGNSTSTFMMLSTGLRYKITCAAGTYDVTASGYSIPTGEWVNLALSQQGTTFKMYMNGELILEDNNATVYPSDMGENLYNYLVKSRWSSDSYTTCMFDEFRIYNRALNDDEINAVMDESVYSLTLSPNSLELLVDESYQLSSTFFPDNANTADLVWKTTDASVAGVVDGMVTASGQGSATISLETADGSVVASCLVNVSVYTGISKQESKVVLTLKDNILTVDSPNQEVVEVYSVTGELILKDDKQAGIYKTSVPKSSRLLIVKGSLGWVRKVVQ
ncbi:InlB B-repeat-containing protein [Plebeiibacterium marinum]|uniref:InlB B-repeat-containing protein n=1 Tax=Plebeiibacterium marinum TaxID=2992111 RepID=A0AAE3SKG3_9BACT|nr:InlB B-repeat-containing protein [Plebeiobacterium marinum]MCW3805495.1 InlB B-repeat-containing protein [Plebeiobacterium marinum]